MKVNHELNNMTWRVKPDEVLIEVGKLFGSKVGLQKLNYEVNFVLQIIIEFSITFTTKLFSFNRTFH